MYTLSGTEEQRLAYYRRRYNRANTVAIQWWALVETSYHYAVPSRDLFYWSNQTQGIQRNAVVYDTTAVFATRNFVSKIQNALTPPQQIWASLVPGSNVSKEDKEDSELQSKFEDLTDKIFDYIRQSNFDLAISECYFDLAIGTAALMVMEGDDETPLRFHSVPANQLAIEESINGFINSEYRTFGDVRIMDIQTMWPRAKLTPRLQIAIDQDPNAVCKALFEGVVYVEGEDKPYRNVLWTDEAILFEEELESSPWIVFRWSKINNETNGRGPVVEALPTIMSLNELMRLELTSANLNVCKPYMAYSDGVFNPYIFNVQPNTVIPIAPSANGNYPIVPLPDVANPAFMQVTSQDLRMQINNLLYANPLGQVNDTPTRTATELALRQRNLAEEIGPVFTRLQQEFLAPLIKRIMYILRKKGLIEPVIVDGKEIDIKYQSPLVTAQGQLDVQGFLQYFQALQGIMGPEGAISVLNPVEVPFWLAEKLSIDTRLLADKGSFEDTLKSNSEMQQTEQMNSLALPAGNPGQLLPEG